MEDINRAEKVKQMFYITAGSLTTMKTGLHFPGQGRKETVGPAGLGVPASTQANLLGSHQCQSTDKLDQKGKSYLIKKKSMTFWKLA